MTGRAIPDFSNPKHIFVRRVLGHNVAEASGILAALSLSILIISSRFPGATVNFTINPYLSLAP